ncbi:MAG TPA: hypothetical protein PKM87_08815 [Methanolinea sp.]|nr:hypothetical protein [Methanolinea sp.]
MQSLERTRGRRVEYLARDRLRSRGFCVIRSAGSRAPVDLVAGRHREVLFVQARRTRRPLADARAVVSRYPGEITRLQAMLRRIELPVQLWLYTDAGGWRIFTIHVGGIAEVSGDDA